jgi:hypothetical protein
MLNSINFAIDNISNKYSHVLEFGVASGCSLRQIRNTLPLKYNVFGFDSFQGLPEDWVGTTCKQGAFSTYGAIPNIKNVKFFDGWFADTIPKYLKIAKPIALLHLDCDLYSSTKTVLDMVGHLLFSDSIICCDEWIYCTSDGTYKDDHEQKAVLEWIDKSGKKVYYYDFVDTTANGIERKVLKIL